MCASTEMKIPKVIHYCWFGNNPLPELAIKCINSWKTYMPDYEIIRWDENNFNVNSNLYVMQAYESKKFAFVSDYVRLYALYNYGGIYLDTDVEVIKPLDQFLNNEAFSGFEDHQSITTGVIGSTKGNEIINIFLDYYSQRGFVRQDGSLDTTTNVKIITDICLKYGFIKDNNYQIVNGYTIYPKTVFCPLNWNSNDTDISNETHTIHYFAGSWHSEKEKNRKKSIIWKLFGKQIALIVNVIKFAIGDTAYRKLKRRFF
ncbi:hypothetical protein BK120_15815 [Paenibacillus sp. FSL A5-0031]|nr:hypothetical protein BK120_15815 [Paenibacillus sp. FSL A5-0031]